MGCQTPCFTGQHPVYLLYGVKHPTFLVSTLLYGVSNTLLYWSAPCVPALWGQTPHVSGQHLALWGVKHPALLVSTLCTCFMGSNTPRFWSAPCFMGCQTPCFTGQHLVYLLYWLKMHQQHVTHNLWKMLVFVCEKMHVNAKLSCDQISHRIMGDKIVFIPTALNGSGCV